MQKFSLFSLCLLAVLALVTNCDERAHRTRQQLMQEKIHTELWIKGFNAAEAKKPMDDKQSKYWKEGYETYGLTHNHASTDDVVFNEKKKKLALLNEELGTGLKTDDVPD